jgi:hypothetical protein
MNLHEAIRAGARRVKKRCTRRFVLKDADTGEFLACALGAAYIGCHPNADLAALDLDDGPIENWVRQLDDNLDVLRVTQDGFEMSHRPISFVYSRNDRYGPPSGDSADLIEADWDALIERLDTARMAGAPFSKVKVCDDPKGGCDESA